MELSKLGSPLNGVSMASIENFVCRLKFIRKYENSGSPVSHWSWIPVTARFNLPAILTLCE